MTKLLSLACAVAALALGAWSLVVSRDASQTLQAVDAAYGAPARRASAALATTPPAPVPPEASVPPSASLPSALPPRETAAGSVLGLGAPLPAPRAWSTSHVGDAGEEPAGVGAAFTLAPSTKPPPPAVDKPTLGYTLPPSHTASETSSPPT